MKKLFSVLMVALLVGTMASCNGNKAGDDSKSSKINDSIAMQMGQLIGSQLKMMQEQPGADEFDQAQILKGIETILKSDTTKRTRSYNQGLAIGMQILAGLEQTEQQSGSIDRKKFLSELKKALNSKDSVDMMKLQQMQGNMMGLMQRAAQAKGADNDKKGQQYIAEQMKKDKSFKKLPSGLVYKIVKQGKGENFNDSATVDVLYEGKHIDGKVFDSKKDSPVPFNLKQVVPGFRELITNLKPGAQAIAIIPGALAYGEQGNPQGGIGPNETLVFEVTTKGVHVQDPNQMPGMPAGMRKAPAPKPAPAKKK